MPQAFTHSDRADTATTPRAAITGEVSATPPAAHPAPDLHVQRNFLLGEIRHQLSRHLQYPTRARRKGWEGEVLIALHVDKRGYLNNVRLELSSGYAMLDTAALGP